MITLETPSQIYRTGTAYQLFVILNQTWVCDIEIKGERSDDINSVKKCLNFYEILHDTITSFFSKM